MAGNNIEHKLFSLYYTLSSFCWLALLIRLGVLVPLVGKKFLPGGIADYFLSLQTICSCLDLLSYIAGRVRFNLKIFVYNFATRMFISYGVIYLYPKVARTEFFSLLILSWGLEELVRYIYFTYKLRSMNRVKIPELLHVIYFNNFLLLFLVRLVSEMCLTFLSLKYIQDENYKNLVRIILVAYLPLSYFYFNGMYHRSSTQKQLRSGHYKTD